MKRKSKGRNERRTGISKSWKKRRSVVKSEARLKGNTTEFGGEMINKNNKKVGKVDGH